MDEEYYAGYSIRNTYGGAARTIAIGKLPGRISYCLYSQVVATITILAYFRSEDAAREAGTLLGVLALANELR